MRPAIVSGIVTGGVPVSYSLIFSLVSCSNPRSLCEKEIRPSYPLVSKVANPEGEN